MPLGLTQTGAEQMSQSGYENQAMQAAQTQQNQQTQGGTANTQNIYSGGQQALQAQLPQQYMQALQGKVPSNFTAPQEVINAWDTNFKNFIEPGLATRYGAGSPAIGSQASLGLSQLLGNLYQQGMSNYSNILGQSTGYAMNPTGTQQQNQQTMTGSQNQLTNQNTNSNYASNQNKNWQIQQPWEIIQSMLGGG